VFAALRYLGFGMANAEIVATDAQGRMRADALEQALAAGAGPTIVIAQAGQINTGAIDPVGAIASACRKHGAWLHVDGAFGLWARVAPELAADAEGLANADSWATDGHKWLQLPFDCGFAIVRDAEAHRRAMTISASYLPHAADEYEPAHYAPELSRRARGFAVWAAIRAFGRRGIADMVRRHCTFAVMLAARLSAEPGVTIVNEVTLNQVIVAFGDSDEQTRRVIEAVQRDNVCFVAGGQWRGRWVLRLPIIAEPLQVEDIARLANCIIAAWRTVRDASSTKPPITAEPLEA
jgi:glutamate/tyrosine decarboxylase-like PLP-dependent enzyme